MALNTYDEQTAAAYKAVREIPREGLEDWRAAIQRHLRPAPGMTVADIGAGTGQFATALRDWFDVSVLAVEPSAAMRAHIPRRPGIDVFAGDATALPLPADSADGAWLSLVIHHIPDLEAAAREIRRVLRPGAPVLIRHGFAGRLDRVDNVRWFPETARSVDPALSVERVCAVFATAGFRHNDIEPVPETYRASLAEFLVQADILRRVDTGIRRLTDEEFRRGKERIRQAAAAPGQEPRTNWLDLLVLR